MSFHYLVLLWFALAVVLGIAELIVPGVYLIFIAVAAALTGVVTLAMPGLPLAGQLVLLGFWSAVTFVFVRRWYVDNPVDTADPLLNDRSARMIGEDAVVAQAIVDGAGRVRIGDSEWPARGPDTEAGTRMRVVGVTGGVVEVAAR